VAVSRKSSQAPTGQPRRRPSRLRQEAHHRQASRQEGRQWHSGDRRVARQAATIKKYLGAGFVVKASVGHVKDLPKASMGIDVKHDFQPEYVVIEGKKKVIADIKAAAKRAEKVLLAPDPDREGEAIAWHIAEEIRPANPNIQRVLFNEITKKAVNDAILHPLELDMHKFESQQARRVLDRLVATRSALCCGPRCGAVCRRPGAIGGRAFGGGSRGRDQGLPSRGVLDHRGAGGRQRTAPFAARVVRLQGEKAVLSHEGQASEVVSCCRRPPCGSPRLSAKSAARIRPAFHHLAFAAGSVQQAAFLTKRTMGLAQRLYEGVELATKAPPASSHTCAPIPPGCPRTRSRTCARGSWIAMAQPRALPTQHLQEQEIGPGRARGHPAHLDAIHPETVRRLLANTPSERGARETEDLVKLYTLIWNRFVACQMTPAVFDQTAIEIDAGPVGLRATGQVMRFAGYLAIYAEAEEGASPDEETDGSLPDVHEGEILRLLGCQPEQHFTQPPPRYSEATLVRELEEKGIGRPSTYATILSTIQDRGYVEKKENRLGPTELGVVVNGLLVKSFPEIVSSDFTAQMEEQLDEVEEGAVDWVKLLRDFYGPFEKDLARAKWRCATSSAKRSRPKRCARNAASPW